ncbi:MAG: L,D-transpeptidase family protein [Deferrisomatales bacterium]
MRRTLLLALLFVAGPAGPAAAAEVPIFRQVAGEIRTVRVVAGDTLMGLAAELGVAWPTLAALNGVADPNRIRVGQEFQVDTRRVVPRVLEDGVVVNLPEAALYLFDGGNLMARLPVGLGRPAHPTPTGSFAVLFKQNSARRPAPGSFAEELDAQRRVLELKGPPDEQTPLGRHWIQLTSWGHGIHGTPFSASLGQFLGYGSVRVGRREVELVYGQVHEGTRVELRYLPVKVAVTPGGELWVEAHPDPYGRGAATAEDVLRALNADGIGRDLVDVGALASVLRDRLGVARRVGPNPLRGAGGGAGNRDQSGAASWRCLDCPPGPNRRVTFQLVAAAPLDLPNPYPLEILDDSGKVVFRPQMVAQTLVHLDPGQSRNLVWEVRDTEGQPLPPGSYTAVVRFFVEGATGLQSQGLPLWIAK